MSNIASSSRLIPQQPGGTAGDNIELWYCRWLSFHSLSSLRILKLTSMLRLRSRKAKGKEKERISVDPDPNPPPMESSSTHVTLQNSTVNMVNPDANPLALEIPSIHVKINMWRIMNCIFLLAFGTAKATLSYMGQSTGPNTLDWVIGVLWALMYSLNLSSL